VNIRFEATHTAKGYESFQIVFISASKDFDFVFTFIPDTSCDMVSVSDLLDKIPVTDFVDFTRYDYPEGFHAIKGISAAG